MIRLNKMTDYAVVVLSHMASNSTGNCATKGATKGAAEGAAVTTAVQMAQDSGVPLPSVSKLLKQLAKAGILSSHRGAGGGYRLDRPAAEISVAQIVTALEGPIALTACIDGADTSCGSMPQCAMSGNWNQVNQAIQSALDGVSLADMMPRPFAFAPPSKSLKQDIKKHLQHSDNTTETQIERAP